MSPTTPLRTGGVASADGLTIRFETVGLAALHHSQTTALPTLVLVHGWSCDRTYWRHQLASLAGRYPLVAVDLAGHGLSDAGRSEWSMKAFGSDVAAVVRQLDLVDVILVGHSMGGDVVVDAADELGDRVRGLVWVDVYDSLAKPADEAAVEAFAAPFDADFRTATDSFVRGMFPSTADPTVVDWVAHDMASQPPAIAVRTIRSAMLNRPRAASMLLGLRLPGVQIVPATGRVGVDNLRRYGIETIRMAGVGHFPMLEAPGRFDDALVEAIARIQAASTR